MKRMLFSLGLGLACALLAAAASADELGSVSSVSGDATAQRAGESPRSLACGDPVYADDTLRTGAGARVGVLLEDVMTHLSADTTVKLGRTVAGMPSATLENGKVRVVDPRRSGAPAHLAALDTRAEIVGNDAEAYVFAEKVGPYAMLCEWDAPLPVGRAGESVTAGPGECVISKPKEPLYTARAHDARIPMAAAEICDLAPQLASLAGAPVNHLTPADVSAPGLGPGLQTAGLGDNNPIAADLPTRTGCDVAGGSCVQPLPFVSREPAPVTGLPAPGVP